LFWWENVRAHNRAIEPCDERSKCTNSLVWLLKAGEADSIKVVARVLVRRRWGRAS